MEISDIGYSYRTALFCHTNRSYTSHLVGKWLTPERDRVEYYYDGPGFWSDIDLMAVILFRSRYSTAEQGIFVCEIKDATETLQRLYVGLYNSGEGIASFSVYASMFIAFLSSLPPQNCLRSGFIINLCSNL